MNDNIARLQALIALGKARLAVLKKYNLDSVGEQTLIAEMEKMVEDERKLELAKANQPQINLPVKKSWQDNVWLFLGVGIIIGVIVLFIGQWLFRVI